MNMQLAAHLMSLVATGAYPTRELIRIAGYSPNTTLRYLGQLEDQGLVERIEARRFGRGRPPIVHGLTPSGLDQLRRFEISSFTQLRKDTAVVWGPRRSFAFWGVPLFGRPDVFSRTELTSTWFEVVVEGRPGVYTRPIDGPDGAFPRLEALLAWAATSGNPRYLAAVSVLLSRRDLSVEDLATLACQYRSVNRVGFLAAMGGANRVAKRFRPTRSSEVMLEEPLPRDVATAKLAARWRVRGPLSQAVAKEMQRLYGGSP